MSYEPSEAGSSETAKSLIRKVKIIKIPFIRKTVPVILTLATLCLVPAVQADFNNGNMDLSAAVELTCSVSSSPTAFGTVPPGADNDTETIVTAVCTPGTTYTLDLGDGLNHIVTGGSGGEYRRQMASAANRMPYVVHTDATRTTPIGASASLAAINNLRSPIVGNGLDQPVIIYGRVLGNESAGKPLGAYADTVVITIAF